VGGGWQASPLPLPLECRHPWIDAHGEGGAIVTSKKSRFSGPTLSNAPSNDVVQRGVKKNLLS
jgi:hypothetical protein